MSLRTTALKAQNRKEAIAVPIISLILAILVIIFLLFVLSTSGESYNIMDIINNGFLKIFFEDNGALNTTDITGVIFWSLPLVLTGLSVAIAFRVGLFNIGGQGQMMIGGLSSAIWAAFIVPKTPILHFLNVWYLLIPTTIFIAILMGGIYGYIPGLLKAYTGAHEVITTIMLNSIAVGIATYLTGNINAPFVQPPSNPNNPSFGRTEVVSPAARIDPINKTVIDIFGFKIDFGNFFGINFHPFLSWTIILVIIATIITWFILWKTSAGYRIRAVGLNRNTAKASGINDKRSICLAMFIAGALAGLAGAFTVIGPGNNYQYVIFSEGTAGFDGIAVALIGQNNPIPVAFASLIFGFLTQLALTIQTQTTGLSLVLPKIIKILQAVIILFAAAPLLSRVIYSKTSLRFGRKERGENLIENLNSWARANKGKILNA
ncbi:MAG: ABC transporter permease [Candidatus Thorarchaeota archaeon]